MGEGIGINRFGMKVEERGKRRGEDQGHMNLRGKFEFSFFLLSNLPNCLDLYISIGLNLSGTEFPCTELDSN